METIENLRVNWMDSRNSRCVEKENMENMENLKFSLTLWDEKKKRACIYIRERYSLYSLYSHS